MTILDVLLNDYLSKDDIQQLARDRGLPTGRTKGDLIALLLSRNLDPSEPLAFLNVTALRDLCREFGIDRSGDRETLTGRLIGAIRTEDSPWTSAVHPASFLLRQREKISESPRDLHSESAGPWTVAGVIVTAAVAGVLVLGVSTLGTVPGVGVSVVIAIALTVVLLRTSTRWHPRLEALIQRPG